jgi:hydroxymethylbilane synthase
VGQGALAVECRAGDEATRRLTAAVEHAPTRTAVDAERAFLAELGGGCDRPVGAHATVAGGDGGDGGGGDSGQGGVGDRGEVTLTGMVATGDGRVVVRHTDAGRDPVELGRRVAYHLLVRARASYLLEVG